MHIRIIAIALLLVSCASSGYSATITKGLMGKQDTSVQADELSPGTFTRPDSVGRTLTLNKFPDIWKTHNARINARAYGSTLTGATIAAAIAAYPNRAIYLEPGAWVTTTALTIPNGTTLVFESGATLTTSGGGSITYNPDSHIDLGAGVYTPFLYTNLVNDPGYSYSMFKSGYSTTHSQKQVRGVEIEINPSGSGTRSGNYGGSAHSPESADIGLNIVASKQGWDTSGAVGGEIDPIFIHYQQGGSADGAALLAAMEHNSLPDATDGYYNSAIMVSEAHNIIYRDSIKTYPYMQMNTLINYIRDTTDPASSILADGYIAQANAGNLGNAFWAFGQDLTAGTGTISSSGTAVTGVATAFSSELRRGDVIYITASNQYRTVMSVTDNTHLVTDTAFSPAASSTAFSLAHSTWANALYANGSFDVGLKLDGATYTTAAMLLATNDKICWNGINCLTTDNTTLTFKSVPVNVLPITEITTTPITITAKTGYYINEKNGGDDAVTFNLPSAATNKRFCFRNLAGGTGVMTLQTNTGQTADCNGTQGATGATVTMAGALGDHICVQGLNANYWLVECVHGTCTCN